VGTKGAHRFSNSLSLESGTLSAQANKDFSNDFVLFENALMEGEERVDRAFTPMASLEAPGGINFLGFETA
jgi:hypothetical protein